MRNNKIEVTLGDCLIVHFKDKDDYFDCYTTDLRWLHHHLADTAVLLKLSAKTCTCVKHNTKG